MAEQIMEIKEEQLEPEKPKRRNAKAADQSDALTVKRIPGAKVVAMGDVPIVRDVVLPLPPDIADDSSIAKVEFVTHNGFKYEIKLGRAVNLPAPVYMILKQGKYKNSRI
jgi:hypothetical protein